MCRKCGKMIEEGQIYRTSVCPFCGADLHSCINCRFYSPDSHYGCKETVDELVKDKERANFCDFYSAVRNPFEASEDASLKASAAAAALFSTGEEKTKTASNPRSTFSSLFGN